MARGYLPWGGDLSPEEQKARAKRLAYREDFATALREAAFILPYEVLELIFEQHEYYAQGNFEMAGQCFDRALEMFIQWRDSNYEPLNYDLYDNFNMNYPDDDNDLLAGFFGWTGDIVN